MDGQNEWDAGDTAAAFRSHWCLAIRDPDNNPSILSILCIHVKEKMSKRELQD